MRQLLAFCVFAATVFTVSCSDGKLKEKEVPEAVKASFNAKYPGAMDVRWKKEKEDGKEVFEAKFELEGKVKEAEFDGSGVFVTEE